MDVLYEYRLSGRRPVIWLCGLVCVFFVALLFKYGAALVVWLPVLFASMAILWVLVRNPVNGVQVTQDALIVSPWHDPKAIPLQDIEAVKYASISDDAEMVIWLRSGRTVRVNHLDIPPMSALRRTLETKAIPVIQT